jgi:hypothetical protein
MPYMKVILTPCGHRGARLIEFRSQRLGVRTARPAHFRRRRTPRMPARTLQTAPMWHAAMWWHAAMRHAVRASVVDQSRVTAVWLVRRLDCKAAELLLGLGRISCSVHSQVSTCTCMHFRSQRALRSPLQLQFACH